jgi:hypothetical protein
LRQHGQREAAPSKLKAKILKEVFSHGHCCPSSSVLGAFNCASNTVLHIL